MSSRISRDTHVLSPVIDEAPIVTKIVEKPVLAEVRGIKNLNVVHKDIVQEIHEQPIIEIARRPETVYVKEQTLIETVMAPAKFETYGEQQAVELNFSKPVETTQQVNDVRHVNLKETIKGVEVHETIERHIIPTITEIHEQKIVNVIEQPIIRTFHEAPIVREVEYTGLVEEVQVYTDLVEEVPVAANFYDVKEPVVMRDSSIERMNMLPVNQLSTRVLTSGQLNEVNDTTLDAPTSTWVVPRGLFSSEEFASQLKHGNIVLHRAKPLSRESFAIELVAQKKLLNKSRYFSKPELNGSLLAQKALLKPVNESVYSRELSSMGQWKNSSWTSSVLGTTGGFLKNAYESAKQYASGAYETAKHMTGDALGGKL